MNLIRKHKISQITNEPLTGVDKEIIDFIENKLSNLLIFKSENYPNSIYYIKDNKVYLEHDSKNILHCRIHDFCGVLIDKYNISFDDVQLIIKYLVVKILKIKPLRAELYIVESGRVGDEAFLVKEGII